MKPGTKITRENFPRCNGRAQIWICFEDESHGRLERVRIIYPDGTVEFMTFVYTWDVDRGERVNNPHRGYNFARYLKACTTTNHQMRSQGAAIRFSKSENEVCFFGGYL